MLARPGTRAGRLALIAFDVVAISIFFVSKPPHAIGLDPYRFDLNVYRIGSQVWLHGGRLYGLLPPTARGTRWPFTYPPFAAIVLAPLDLVPMGLAGALITLAGVAAAILVLRLFAGRLFPGRGSAGVLAPARLAPAWWAAAWLVPPMLLLEPVRATFDFGQVNLILMALVSADCLARQPRWPRGVLVGLAAAVKLTPAVFVVYFLLRRDYRAAAAAGLSFAACTAAGFGLAWSDSVHYWTVTVLSTSRFGNPGYAGNQSLTAVLARAGIAAHTTAGTAAWLALSAVVAVLAGYGIRRALTAGQDCLAVSLTALAGLLVSPISWTHHWVWCGPVLLTLVALAWSGRSRLDVLRRDLPWPRPALLPAALALAGLAIFVAGPQWWFPAGHGLSLHWGPWEQVVGSAYVLFAVAVLALAAAGLLVPGCRGSRGRLACGGGNAASAAVRRFRNAGRLALQPDRDGGDRGGQGRDRR